MKIFDSPKLKSALNKILLVFIFYVTAAAAFNGFYVKWTFADINPIKNNFQEIFNGTGDRPFVHRQLMITVAKEIRQHLPEKQQQKLIDHLHRYNFISQYYARAVIEPEPRIEYFLIYQMCFLSLLASMFIWRQIGAEITGSKLAGTLAACIFALIFPLFETVGGYFYDFGELLFFSLAVLFAMRGWWVALIILSPIAEYNKESFLFFVATLFPIITAKVGKIKAIGSVASAIILCGLVYLYVSALYAGNGGGALEFHLDWHLDNLFALWTNFEIQYGVYFGQGMFLPHVILVAWILKCAWKNLPTPWKFHAGIAFVINLPLYMLFCSPGELRNLSILYAGFIVMLAIFIKNILAKEAVNFET